MEIVFLFINMEGKCKTSLKRLIICFMSDIHFILYQNDIPENELLKLLSDVNMVDIEGDVTEESDLMPMMQGMMKSLLSKDILYPSLKDISTKVSE